MTLFSLAGIIISSTSIIPALTTTPQWRLHTSQFRGWGEYQINEGLWLLPVLYRPYWKIITLLSAKNMQMLAVLVKKKIALYFFH